MKIRLAVLIKVLSGVLVRKYVHKYTKNTRNIHKHKYIQIILVFLHQTVLCIDGVKNSLHIMEHLAMHVLTSMFVHIVTSCCL